MSRKRNTAPGIHKYWENVKGIEYGYESIIIIGDVNPKIIC